ncbi:DUF4956 domain-containing protein [Salinispira pacifica]|uniref:DUF4956 domain-containing protein n=1 Tax=Salinispira pacifica TaxID=1307761 RepID=V5WE84_9SPIO|nr:DUF4956 domain-containing protein [Salinispira pacifica]AHC13950.1 hypothetical protein L21SP2_0518 [Salinispira pacifica]
MFFHDNPLFLQLLLRFVIDISVISVLVFLIFFRHSRRRKSFFSFVVFNIVIFFTASFLSRVQIDTAFAFGIFAVLSVLRYRTRPIAMKEMTYLFVSIILGVLNSTLTSGLHILEILLANISILGSIYLMEAISWQLKIKRQSEEEAEQNLQV